MTFARCFAALRLNSCFGQAIQDSFDDNESFYSCYSEEPLQEQGAGPQRSTWRRQRSPRDRGFEELRHIWEKDIKPDFPEIEHDLYLSPSEAQGGTDGLLMRFLRAERNQRSANPVRSAADRLRRTAEFRRAYACMDFHRKGMARKLFMHASNPGASVYFADIGLRDCDGEPVLVGRASLMNENKAPGRKLSDNMLPTTHLRATMFVVERAALETRTRGSYILDLGDYPTDNMAEYSHARFWNADGAVDDRASVQECRAPEPSVRPHLPEHVCLKEGLPVLKESMRMMQTYYPGLLKKVYFYRPPLVFQFLFKIFSLWVPADTRERFVIVKKGEEHRYFLAPEVMDKKKVPVELGGKGPALDGDRFLAAAIERYDSSARLDP